MLSYFFYFIKIMITFQNLLKPKENLEFNQIYNFPITLYSVLYFKVKKLS